MADSQISKPTATESEMSNVRQPEKDSNITTTDPLYKIGLEDAVDSRYTQLPTPLEFNVSFAGLMPLIDEVYALLCHASDEIARNLPLSAFSYYIILHLWARIAAIRRHHGRTTKDELDLLSYFRQDYIPAPIAHYLGGIGDLIDSTEVEYLVNLAVQPTADKHGPSGGWAGRITDKTHNVYESIPMPGVAVARMYADLAAGLNPDLAGDWQLPDTIRPVDGERFIGGNPTVNLLGYARSVAVDEPKLKLIQQFDTKPDDPLVAGPFAWNLNFVHRISVCLGRANRSFEMVQAGCVSNSRFGSQALMSFTVKATEDPNVAPPTTYYADNAIAARCSVKQDDRFSTVAQMFTYRIRKDTFPAGVNQWSCFDFNNYTEVPHAWVKNRNELFDDVVLWNIARFGTSFTNAKRLRGRYVRAPIIDDPQKSDYRHYIPVQLHFQDVIGRMVQGIFSKEIPEDLP